MKNRYKWLVNALWYYEFLFLLVFLGAIINMIFGILLGSWYLIISICVLISSAILAMLSWSSAGSMRPYPKIGPGIPKKTS